VGAQDEQERIRLSAEIKIHPEATMNDQNPSMDFNPGPAPTKTNKRTWLIVGIVVVVLCCFCFGVFIMYQYLGDPIMQAIKQALGH